MLYPIELRGPEPESLADPPPPLANAPVRPARTLRALVAPPAAQTRPVAALPLGGLTFLCSLGTGVIWNAIYFIAKSEYGFSETDSLLLAFVNGLLYMGVALAAGRVVRTLERRLSTRGALAVVLVAQAALAPLVVVFPGTAMLWFVAIVLSAMGALQWPVVEHYLASGRHGPEMRQAIGWWNTSWMAATAISLAATGPLAALGLMRWAIPSLLPINLIALLFLAAFPRRPAAHCAEERARHVPPSYHGLLAASRVLHPLGYLVLGALAPVLPYLFQGLGTAPSLQAPLGSTWQVARLVAVVLLWRTAFWHGRAATLALAGVLLATGFAVAVSAPSEWALALGLAALGAGQGVAYYTAIYSGLAVGAAEVDAGGTHEALVGTGYFAGPALGLATIAAGAGTPVFIGLVLGALALGFVAAFVRGGRASSHATA
jgi:hypothetical protein